MSTVVLLTNDEFAVSGISNTNGKVERMPRALPPLAWFRAFECSGRHLSFTAAALELGLTQSAISQQIRLLEQRLGCALFIRKHRGLAFTDDGRRLMPTVSAAIATLRSATDRFETAPGKPTLTIATSVSIAQWYLTPHISQFLAENPRTAVRIATKVWPDEFSSVSADVEIRFDTPDSTKPDSERIDNGDMVVAASPALLQQAGSNTTAHDLIASLPLIQVLGTADGWEKWTERSGTRFAIEPQIYVESHGMAVDMARAGNGIAFTHLSIAAPSVADGSLVCLEYLNAFARDAYYLTIHAGPNQALALRFKAWLASQIKQVTEAVASSSQPAR